MDDSPDAEFGTGASTAPSPGTAAVNEEVEVPQEDLAPSPSPGLLAVPEVEIRDDDVAAETMELHGEDVAFILGQKGKTKMKLERIANVRLEFVETGDLQSASGAVMWIVGTKAEREVALQFLGWVMNQRVGDVVLDVSAHRHHCTTVDVPKECIGFVMGSRGQSLRDLETEWGSVLFFIVDPADRTWPDGSEKSKVAIFGNRWSRRGSQLKTMSLIENKLPRHYKIRDEEGNLVCPFDDDDDGDFGTDMMAFADDDYRYALGSRGSTKRKLAAASGCIIEFIGMVGYFCGTAADRTRALEYMKWLLAQRRSSSGRSELDDMAIQVEGRDDVTEIDIPQSYIGFLRGAKGAKLREIETVTGTFCFSDSNHTQTTNRILVFSFNPEARRRAEIKIRDRIAEKARIDAGGGGPSPRSMPMMRPPQMLGSPPLGAGLSPYRRDVREDDRHRRDSYNDRDGYRRNSRGDDFRDHYPSGRGDPYRRDSRGDPRDDGPRDNYRSDYYGHPDRPLDDRRDDRRGEYRGRDMPPPPPPPAMPRRDRSPPRRDLHRDRDDDYDYDRRPFGRERNWRS